MQGTRAYGLRSVSMFCVGDMRMVHIEWERMEEVVVQAGKRNCAIFDGQLAVIDVVTRDSAAFSPSGTERLAAAAYSIPAWSGLAFVVQLRVSHPATTENQAAQLCALSA